MFTTAAFHSSVAAVTGGTDPPTLIAFELDPVPVPELIATAKLFNSVQDVPLNSSVLTVLDGPVEPPKTNASVLLLPNEEEPAP